MKIQQKLFTAFLCGSVVLVGAMYGLMQWSFDQGMIDYVNQRELNAQTDLAGSLAQQYQANGDWDFLRDNHRLWRQLLDGSRNSNAEERSPRDHRPPHERNSFDRHHRPPHHPPPHRSLRPDDRRSFGTREQTQRPPKPKDDRKGGKRPPPRTPVILLDQDKQAVFGRYDPDQKTPLMPIVVNQQTVGWLTVPSRNNMSEAFDVGFVKQQQTAFIVISVILLVLSACIAYPLAIALTKPIKKIAAGTHEITSGNFDVEINHNSNDELGQLTRDFNTLAKTLAANETARKRWIADISHELRTPLAISRGELEAMIDGVRPLSTDNIQSTHQEVLHLQRIVDDLYELANADIGALTYQKEELDFAELVEEQVEKQVEKAKLLGLAIESHIPDNELELWGDETRLSQLINNLITNSIKYTDSDGIIKVRLGVKKKVAQLIIEDSSPGVSPQEIEKLFDPLYRVENSRNRKTGGSGLGLAICKKIVEGHNGTIAAESSELGGLRMVITLPTLSQPLT
ncbi:MAG: ATP-binding protein [Pseudomonadales bacterium]|nr:ATP-binding protein [Pseudomonadales bacterium]